MWVGIVGSRSLGECSCDAKEKHWPPTPEEKAHQEECPKVHDWLLMLKVVTRLVTQHPELAEPVKPREKPSSGIVSGGAQGADTLAMNAAEMLGVPPKRQLVIRPKNGTAPFRERALARNTLIAEKADLLIAVFSPGRRSPGTSDTVRKALAMGKPVHVWHEGRWTTE